MSEVRSHRVRVGDVTLHVEERGRGIPLVVLHGFTGSSESMAVCRGFADRHRVLAIDLVGHGRSDAPEDPAAYAMSRCVEQVDAVLARLEARPAHLLGYSMGGRVALSLLARRPASVRSLVLVGASAGLEGADERRARVEADHDLAKRIESEGLPAFVDAWMALPLFASQAGRLGPDALAAARAQRLDNRPHGLAHSLRGMGTGAQDPVHAELARHEVPVLFLVGEEDAKFAGIAGDLAGRMPRAEVAAIPNAGHAAHLENPTAFQARVRAFLQAQGEERP